MIENINTGTDLLCIKNMFMLGTEQHTFTEGKIYTIVGSVKSKNIKHTIVNIVNDLGEIHYIHYNKLFETFEIYKNIN